MHFGCCLLSLLVSVVPDSNHFRLFGGRCWSGRCFAIPAVVRLLFVVRSGRSSATLVAPASPSLRPSALSSFSPIRPVVRQSVQLLSGCFGRLLSGSFVRCPIVGYLAVTAICRPSPSISVRPFPVVCLANNLSPLVRHCLLASHCLAASLAATPVVVVIFRPFSRLCLRRPVVRSVVFVRSLPLWSLFGHCVATTVHCPSRPVISVCPTDSISVVVSLPPSSFFFIVVRSSSASIVRHCLCYCYSSDHPVGCPVVSVHFGRSNYRS